MKELWDTAPQDYMSLQGLILIFKIYALWPPETPDRKIGILMLRMTEGSPSQNRPQNSQSNTLPNIMAITRCGRYIEGKDSSKIVDAWRPAIPFGRKFSASEALYWVMDSHPGEVSLCK
jgi:hypothetical protein